MSDAVPIACRQVTGLRRGATRFGAISDRSVSTSRFEAKAEIAMKRPTLYKLGRINGTREIVVRPNYVMDRAIKDGVEVLRVLHAAQKWPK